MAIRLLLYEVSLINWATHKLASKGMEDTA